MTYFISSDEEDGFDDALNEMLEMFEAAIKEEDEREAAKKQMFDEMIVDALTALKGRKGSLRHATGSSRQAILKYFCAYYKFPASAIDKELKMALKMALKRGVTDGLFKMAASSGNRDNRETISQ